MRPDEAVAIELGAMMREARIARRRELADVAAELRIREIYLRAIEDGRLDDLPGTTYAFGFVRAYAEHLGLDAGDIARRFREAAGGGTGQLNLVLPSPVAEGRMPTGAILLVAAIVALGAYGGWYYLSTRGHDAGQMIAALPDRIEALIRRESAPALAPPPSEAVPAPSAEEPAATLAPTTSGPAASPAPESTPAAEPAPAPTPAPMAAAPAAPKTPAPTAAPSATRTASVPPSVTPKPASTPPASEAKTPAAAPAETSPAPAAAPAESADRDEGGAPPPPERVDETAPAATLATASAPAAMRSASPEGVTVQPLPPRPPARPAATTPTAASAPATTASTEAVPPPPAPPAASPHDIVLVANSDSWIELRSATGERIYSRVLRAGERYDVPDKAGLTMMTGNAGGIQVIVDGKTAPSLGAIGAVRRDIPLDPVRLLAGTAVPPQP